MNSTRFLQKLFTISLGLILSVVVTCGVTFGDVLDGDSLTPAAFTDVDDNVFAATTSAPILLHRGTVLETSTDLSFDYAYHPISGKQTLVVRDVDTATLPTIITNGSENVVAWKDKTPFSRSNSLAKALNQTTYQEYDEQGRLVKTVGNDNFSEFVIYDNNRRIQISAWDVKTKLSTLPIQVIETNDADSVTSIYSVSPTNVVVESDKPIGVSSNKQKVPWTRYHYDPLHGGLEYVDKYHTLATDEGKLGDNYYRTTYIRDQLGREVATARFVDNDYVGTKYKYDEWNRVRATVAYAVKDNAVTTLVPFTVNDLDWRGNVVFTASYDSEPDWNNVVKNKNYASVTEGKNSASRYNYDIYGRVWKAEVLNNTSERFDATTFKYDNVGRNISTTHNNTTVETSYEAVDCKNWARNGGGIRYVFLVLH